MTHEEVQDRILREVVNSPDARVWAEAFMDMVRAAPNFHLDVDLMLGWFSNAMMAAHDHAKRGQR